MFSRLLLGGLWFLSLYKTVVKMLFLLRLILVVVVLFLLIRAVLRFLAGRFLKQQWPFHSFFRNRGNGTSAPGVVTEEADFEVIETTIKENEESS